MKPTTILSAFAVMTSMKKFSVILGVLVPLMTLVGCEESPEPEQFLRPRNFNPHPYSSGVGDQRADEQRANERRTNINRNGPVLFPNDGPVPPRPPLVVTSRPITEQIARSDQNGAILTPKPPTRSQNEEIYTNQIDYPTDQRFAQQIVNSKAYQDALSNTNDLTDTPNGYLTQIVDSNGNRKLGVIINGVYQDVPTSNLYENYFQNGPNQILGSDPLRFDLRGQGYAVNEGRNASFLDRHPYANAVRKSQLRKANHGRPGYTSFEERTAVPPLYQALENYAKTKGLKGKGKRKGNSASKRRNQLVDKGQNPSSNDGIDDDYYNDDNSANEAKQYAFSYSVRDHHTGDDFSHSQRHSGSATNGEYRVKLPDGRVQIVSYTADNGGYKAVVRYEEDEADSKPIVEYDQDNQKDLATPQNLLNYQQKLGRIVVPSQEEKDYQDFEYVYDESGFKNQNKGYSTVGSHYVTNDNKELLITSKPSFIYPVSPTPLNALYKQVYPISSTASNLLYPTQSDLLGNRVSATPSNLLIKPVGSTPSNPLYKQFGHQISSTPPSVLYKQMVYHDNKQDSLPSYVVTPTSVVYIKPKSSTPIYTTKKDQTMKYLHFYDAESVKFVSTTPKYLVNGNSVSTRDFNTANRQNAGNFISSSTPAPGLDGYDHLDSPNIGRFQIKQKELYPGRFTSVAPILYGSSSVRPTSGYGGSESTSQASVLNKNVGLGRYFVPPDSSVNIRKYFTYKKR